MSHRDETRLAARGWSHPHAVGTQPGSNVRAARGGIARSGHAHGFLARDLPWPLLAGLAILALVPGCSKAPAEPNIAKAVAPVAPTLEASLSVPTVKFVDITKDSGITFTHQNLARGEKLLPETMGSGVAFLDFDNDGDQDLLFVNSAPWPGQKFTDSPAPKPIQALYRNDGKGRFADATPGSGLDVTLCGMGVAAGDYDGDGDTDVYLTAVGGGRLFRNEGNGKFADVTEAAKAGGGDGWQSSAAFFDLENDGDLDLIIGSYVVWSAEIDRGVTTHLAGRDSLAYDPPTAFGGTQNILLRNDGGTFTDISEDAGLHVRTPDHRAPMAKTLGIAPRDIDGDGLIDLAIANDTVPNFLFRNLGDGKFEELGTLAGVAFDQSGQARGAMGIDWGDFRGDGSVGLAVANFANEMMALYVADEPSEFQFSDLANLYGLGAPTQPPLKFGLFFFDYDLDGRLDLLSANGHLESDISLVQASETYPQPAQLFWNSGKPGRSMFVQVGPDRAGGDLFRPIVGRGSAYADIDADGDLDVVLATNGGSPLLLRNEGGSGHHWIRLKLVGTRSNREGIGARVTAKVGDRTVQAQVFPSKGYLSSVELPITLGLGASASVDELTIAWPSGDTSKLESLAADRVHTIEEADDAPKTAAR